MSASGLYLKIRILLRCGASDDRIKAGELFLDVTESLLHDLIHSGSKWSLISGGDERNAISICARTTAVLLVPSMFLSRVHRF